VSGVPRGRCGYEVLKFGTNALAVEFARAMASSAPLAFLRAVEM
jgi:hypothetical protein